MGADGAVAWCINGQRVDSVPAADRGLQYGDGLFETVAVADGRPQLWERHLARLAAGCVRLGLPAPPPDLLTTEAAALCTGRRRAVLKIMLTRGSGGRGYRPPAVVAPTRILACHPFPDHPPEWATAGVAVRLCRTPLGRNPALAGLKHMNRLEQVLARAEWDDPAIAEGLMFDTADQLVEGTMSNVFLVADGCLRTPDLSWCGVAGIIRAVILELAPKLGIPCDVRPLGRADVARADEVFVTNSVIGLWPVCAVDGRAYPVGPVTRRLAAALGETVGGG